MTLFKTDVGILSTFLMLLILLAGVVPENPGPQFVNTGDVGCTSVLHLNIRSIRHKLEYIKDNFLDFDVLSFSEFHLTNEIGNDFIKLDGFCDPFRKDSAAHSGGLLIYVSYKLVAARKPDLESQSVSSIWVEIKYKDTYFLLSNVYRSPNTPISFGQDLNI